MKLNKWLTRLKYALSHVDSGWYTLKEGEILHCKDPHNINIEEFFTEKQSEVFRTAKERGYYSFPRKINTIKLAIICGISPSTLCVHLQKIESKLSNNY